MSKKVDEAEHSLEMHIPYIKRMFGSSPFKLVPIMVGNLSDKKEQEYGKKLSKYVQDEKTLFVISSDFCHWGDNFEYYYFDKKKGGNIYECIETLDKRGMSLIEH
jgi:AmmeMemoRadiSam system protein B